jgi:phosphatidylinositol-3-phosphatase
MMSVTLPRIVHLRRVALFASSVALVLLASCNSGADGSATSPVSPTSAATSAIVQPSASQSGSGQGRKGSQPPIVLIVVENTDYAGVVGSRDAPYINDALIAHGRTFTNYSAVAKPSLPNYLAMTSGSTQGKQNTDDITAGQIKGDNVFSQLSEAKIAWKAYQEDLPSRCFRGEAAGSFPSDYALKHDPAMAYAEVAHTSRCDQVVPFTDLDASRLPAFSFVTPNECNDAHSCPISTADAWLSRHVPPLLRHGAVVILTTDEASDNPGGGGHILTVEVGPGVAPGTRDGAAYSHYSLLAGLETFFGLPLLGSTRAAAPLPI